MTVTELEDRFRALTLLLYDTEVSTEVLDEEVFPYLSPGVRFVDPWQEAAGKQRYRLGAAGFHSMLSFDFHVTQAHVELDPDQKRGRALVEGVMHLRPWHFPLRTFVVYEFVLPNRKRLGGAPPFLITQHEEMWSVGDLLAALPLLGRLYRPFRRLFAHGFLAASYVACGLTGQLPPKE